MDKNTFVLFLWIVDITIKENHSGSMYDPDANDHYTSCRMLIMSYSRSNSSIKIMRSCSVISDFMMSQETPTMPGLLFMNPEVCAKLYNKGAPAVGNLPELITDATRSLAQEKNWNNVTDSRDVTDLIIGQELVPGRTIPRVNSQNKNVTQTMELSQEAAGDGKLGVEWCVLKVEPESSDGEKLALKRSVCESTSQILDDNSNSTITCKPVIDSETLLVETSDNNKLHSTDTIEVDAKNEVTEISIARGDPESVDQMHVIGSSLERVGSLDQETVVIDDDLEKVFTEKEMAKFNEEAEAKRYQYGTHVASFLANNTVAIMMMLDNKMVTGAFRQGLPDSSSNNQETASSGDSNTSTVRDQFQYADPEESGDADHMLMSNTQGYLKGKKPPDARSKSFGNSVSEVFTEAFAKIEEMGQEARNKQFHKHFPDIPTDEIIINSYSCAYVKEILLQGRLYVSKNWLCFHSNIFGFETRVSVPIGEVKDITRERTALIVPNAIGIHTENEKYVFGSLMSRAATYKMITRILQEYREREGLEGVPPGSRESSINDSELDTPDSETVFDGKGDCYLKNEEEAEETPFALDPNSNPINTTTESQRNPAKVVSSTSSFSERMKEMICAISVFKSLLRTGSSFRSVPHSQLFLVVTFLLIVFLFISALLLSFKVWRLNPQGDQNSPEIEVDDQNLHGFLRNHERHSKTVQSIRLLLEEHLRSLAKVQDSLQYLHKSATSQPETETVTETKAKPKSDEL